MTNENQYFIKKMVSNDTILSIQKMLNEGKTYEQIKEKTCVSIATISRVKNGKIKPNRNSEKYEKSFSIKDIENLQNELDITRIKVVELCALNSKLKKENIELKKDNEKLLNITLKAKRILEDYKKYGLVEKYRELKKQEEGQYRETENQCSEFNRAAGINRVDFFNSDKGNIKTQKLSLFED